MMYAILLGITAAGFVAQCILYGVSLARGYTLQTQAINLVGMFISAAAVAVCYTALVTQ